MAINIGNLDIFGLNKTEIGEDKQGAEQIQSYGREYDVSPIFSFINSEIVTAGSEDIIDFAVVKPKSLKYLPFNTLNIINNSSVAIKVYINQDRNRPLIIPSGVIQPIDNTISPAISSILWENIDGSTQVEVGEIQFLVSRDNVTTDLLAKRVHQLLFKGRGLKRR